MTRAPVPFSGGPVVALSGGVGGARLIDGLAAVLPGESLTVIVNTGDDFVHWGLSVCPDLDTIMYTLAGLADAERGWGLADETFRALSMVERYRGPGWFALGDGDLATHIVRTEALRQGRSLSAITDELRRALDVAPRILPMSDQPRPTAIDTVDQGVLPFQQWLVRERCRPVPRDLLFGAQRWSEWPSPSRSEASSRPVPAPGLLDAIADAGLIVFAPSNPYVSIDPILTLPGVCDALRGKLVIAVSPIIAGHAIKGPLAAMIPALTGRQPGAAAIAAHYRDRHGDLLDALVVERGDEDEFPAESSSPRILATATIMRGRADRVALARDVLSLAERLGS